MKEAVVHMGLQMAWKTQTMWFVHFAETVGGKLATFTAVNLIANVGYAKLACCVVISHASLSAISHVSAMSFGNLLDGLLGANNLPSLPLAHCTDNNVQQNEICPNSKMRRATLRLMNSLSVYLHVTQSSIWLLYIDYLLMIFVNVYRHNKIPNRSIE